MSGPQVYGGWRERRGFGIGALSGPQTAAGLVGVVVALGVVLIAPSALPLLVVPLAVAALSVLVRHRGESLLAISRRHVGWQVRERRGGTRYRASQSMGLPGPLTSVELLVHAEGTALLLDRARHTLTALREVEPQGLEFADPHQVQGWVAGWGDWLAHLGYVPQVRHVAVTVFSRPVSPAPQRPEPTGIMAEVAALNGAAHQTRTMISLTVGAAGQAPESGATHLLEVLDSLQVLDRCGMTVLPALTVDDLVCWVRDCYEPSVRSVAPDAHWQDARPSAWEESWDRVRHDGAWSAGFVWDECPGEAMGAHTIARLLAPAAYASRITVVVAPVPAHVAAREVDRQAEAAVFRSQYRRRLGRDETARERLDVERAQRTAHEQARGSGLVDVGVYAVVSVECEQDLDHACADLHNRAGEARLRLRRAYGEQREAFAASLGLGHVPRRS